MDVKLAMFSCSEGHLRAPGTIDTSASQFSELLWLQVHPPRFYLVLALIHTQGSSLTTYLRDKIIE